MWMKAVAYLCLFLYLVHGPAPEQQPQYLLLVPSVLRGEATQKICVLFTHLNESLSLRVTLEQLLENTTLIEETLSETDVYRCWDIQLPKPKSSEVVFITLQGKGETLLLKGRKAILLQPRETLVFVQTDKPIYKPDQNVQFRAVALDENFRPVNETFHEIFIEDQQKNRIAQWRSVSTDHGIAQLTFPLSNEPSLGVYKVGVKRAQGSIVEQSFTVDEYVLPKFEVLVKVPNTITVLDQHIHVSVCGIYTYQKPVPGLINVNVCRKFQHFDRYGSCRSEEFEAVCEKYSRQADEKGCFSEVVDTKIFQMKRSGYDMRLKVTASITEEGTGLMLSGDGGSDISTVLAKVTFQDVDSHFKRGIPLYGQVRLEDAGGTPIVNETVTIYMDSQTNVSVTTDQEGKAPFSMDTSHIQSSSISLRATYKSLSTCYMRDWIQPSYQDAYHTVKQFYSQSQSFLKIEPVHHLLPCEKQEELKVHYVLSRMELRQATETLLYFLVMAKGSVVWITKQIVSVGEGNGTSMTTSLLLPVTSQFAPLARVLVFTALPSGEIIADSVTLKIAKCFSNKVSLQFSRALGLPSSPVSLLLEAAPDSLCAVRAVDKSVLLMKPEKELSADSVYKLLPVENLSGYHHGDFNLEESREGDCIPRENIYLNGFYYHPMDNTEEIDAYDIFKDLGLKAFTNFVVRKPVLCPTTELGPVPMMRYYKSGAVAGGLALDDYIEASPLTLETLETVRKYFPETWLWNVVPVGSSGKAELPITIPDTITEWKAGTFCTAAAAGFGLSPTVSLTAFQPFFVEITLPYSGIHGESFPLNATVFNYLKESIRVQITLRDSEHFHAEAVEKVEDAYCVTADGRRTVSWVVTLKTLGEATFELSAETVQGEGLCGNEIVTVPSQGRKDTVIRTMLVEPEGVEKDLTHNALLCTTGDSLSEKVTLQVPENAVEGSARAYVSILGDLLGSALPNLDKLLQMPFGCGEQNMVLFTPNIFMLEYLNSTGQLTEEIHSKALGFLIKGYQQQLKYKHADGSYSAFGPSHGRGQGNTWLTAFVLKSFARARFHIFISEKHLVQSLLWLSSLQKENGCFISFGQLFNNAMKGGVDDEVTLTAFITIALLEYPLPITHPLVRNALFCLDTALKGVTSTYVKALMSYAFTLAGNDEKRAELLESLKAEAVKDGDTMHWQRSGKLQEQNSNPFFPSHAPSAEIEMTSYMLLAVVTHQPMSPADLQLSSMIVKWIIRQQNPSGGFSSTQDTVVALQALAKFSTVTYKKNSDSTITVRSESGFQAQYHVDDANRLLLQRGPLPDVPGDYTVEVKGEGCTHMQVTLKYNLPPPEGDAPFTLHVVTNPSSCSQTSHQQFEVLINTSYVGPRPSSNMAIVDVKMPSGYMPVKTSVRSLSYLPGIARTESKPNSAIIYLEQVTNETISFKFSVEQDIPVSNLKPAIVKVYDYYETEEFAIAEYSAPCSTDSSKGNLR